MTVFDALASADFLVRDKDEAVATMQTRLGFMAPKPRWSHGAPGQGFRVTFCRANPSLVQSPTLIELIEPAALDRQRALGEVVPNVQGLADLQRNRPLKTHGAPVASSHVDELIEIVRSKGLRHWVQPRPAGFPFLRLWMGITAEELSGYHPDGDGGLMLEVVDTATLGLPADALHADPPAPADLTPGAMTQTLSRGFLVADLDRALDALMKTFEWEPEQPPERASDGSRRAVLGFALRQSARIELLEPAGDREESDFLRRFGPGIWHVRIGVHGLAEKADDLRARNTPFRVVETGFAVPDTVLRVDASVVPGCLFEFAAAAS
jgi:hypothetical protein